MMGRADNRLDGHTDRLACPLPSAWQLADLAKGVLHPIRITSAHSGESFISRGDGGEKVALLVHHSPQAQAAQT
jgi:hypothetical protein